MIIEIPPITVDWTWTWISGIIVMILLAWAIIAGIGTDEYWWDGWVFGLSAAVLVIFGIVGFGIFGLMQPNITVEQEVKNAKVAALEDAGFSRVDLFSDNFTASRDGEYFAGTLYELSPSTFQVNEIVEVSR